MRVIFTFSSLHLVLKAEKLLREADDRRILARATATPPGLSADICGMSLELLDPSHQKDALQYLQKQGLEPLGVHQIGKSGGTTGLIIGQFSPLHRGHIYLLDFAQSYCDTVYVVLLKDKNDIDVSLRLQWLTQKRPGLRIITTDVDCKNDQGALRAVLTDELGFTSFDYFFSGNLSDQVSAATVQARFIPVDPLRELTPADSDAIKSAPLAHWSYLPEDVRLHYLKRVCIFGPESTGKSTLTANLARHFATVHVPEYARTFMETRDNELRQQDLPAFARGMMASENALAHRANRVIFADTDALTTVIWSNWLYKQVDSDIIACAREQKHDLYLLLDVDVPWVEDPQRYLPQDRQNFLDACKQTLTDYGRKYVLVSGSFDQRLSVSIKAVEDLLQQG